MQSLKSLQACYSDMHSTTICGLFMRRRVNLSHYNNLSSAVHSLQVLLFIFNSQSVEFALPVLLHMK